MLIQVLADTATRAGDRPFLVTPDRNLTYAQALEHSEALARGLRHHSIDRYAAVVSEVADQVTLMCASSAAGSEGCVYPPAIEEDDLADLAGTFDHQVVITDRPLGLQGRRVVPLASLVDVENTRLPAPVHTPALILTTGTTGRPKGARHDWGRLMGSGQIRADNAEARWLLAYNLNQFAGVQVLLHVLLSGATMVVPRSPQPRAALEVMTKFGVTHASGTPTFWRFLCSLVDRETAAAIPLRQITLGGEAIQESVLESLRSLFPAARISQVYASTEFGSSVSVRDGRHGLPLSVLNRGEDAAVMFKIVDGELYARSRVGMLGYHGQQEVEDGWRPTGDLVEVRDDRIEFVGRTTEVINVGGVKVHPLVVEERIAGVNGVRTVYVHGRPNPVSGEIVVAEVVAQAGVDQEELDAAIRAACGSMPPAARPRRVKFVDEIPMREGKILRRSAR